MKTFKRSPEFRAKWEPILKAAAERAKMISEENNQIDHDSNIK
ncbi:hypothetical protein [Robertkochia solimangrovi]|nr:hypothetical protein [Robertkochia solimangrovi]